MMTLEQYAGLRSHESDNNKCKSMNALMWVIGLVVVAAIITWTFNKNCADKVAVATTLGNVGGRLNVLESVAEKTSERTIQFGQNFAKLDGGLSTWVGCVEEKLGELGNGRCYQSFLDRCGGRGRGHGCCGDNEGRKFMQRDTYIPNTTEVVVEATCG